MENKDTEEIRKKVSEDYARAVTSGAGCCQPKTGCGNPTDLVVPKGNAAKLAGYQKADVEGIPQDAVENSFGCGHPPVDQVQNPECTSRWERRRLRPARDQRFARSGGED